MGSQGDTGPATATAAQQPDLLSQNPPKGPHSLYASYLDLYQRRIKKGPTAPSADAAGVIYGVRYHGRSTPLKGKGTPPADHKEVLFVSGKHMVPGRSFASQRSLLKHHEDASPESSPKTSLRFLPDASFRSHLAGVALEITSEPPAYRPLRSPGNAAPKHRTARVLCLDSDAVTDLPSEYGDLPATPRLLTASWDAEAAEAIIREYTVGAAGITGGGSRPTTAPAHMTEARRAYNSCLQGHNDVIRYRHSGGICPDSYTFSDARPMSPQVSLPSPEAARCSFKDAREEYMTNRLRSKMSAPVRYS